MYILGLCTMGEAAATLIKDGEIVAAAEEERFSRIKHHIGFPVNAVRYCLGEAGITIDDLDHVALYWKPWVIGRRLWVLASSAAKSYAHFRVRLQRGRDQMDSYYFPMFRMKRLIQETFGGGNFAFHYIDHHLCHAASAFFVSPFERAAIFTIDGVGESTTAMHALGEGTKIKVFKRVKLPHSMGQFYSAMTNFLGFDMLQGDEYKVMGLAAYGEPVYYDFLRKHVVSVNGNGEFFVDISYLDHQLARHHIFSGKITKVFGPPRKPGDEISENHANIAASAQKVLEEVVLSVLEYLYRLTRERNLCMAGGVALNSVMNGRILRESPFDNLFVQPAAHDAGCSLGGALHVFHKRLGRPRKNVLDHVYFGPQFTNAECKKALEDVGLNHDFYSDDLLVKKVATLLAEGKIVGWFQGRMEWGPRALGNRSFLADPRRKDMRSLLNEKVKLREPFRPLAPSMLEESVVQFFGKNCLDPYMVKVFPVRAEMREKIPAVVHVDGTARPQTVSRKVNPRYYELLREFEKLTGVPVLLNTSFNIQEPIVCTPQDAIDCFKRATFDCLVLENYLVMR